MNLFIILLTVVAMLTILSGFSIFAGSSEKDRASSAWFFVATLGASAWAITISVFLGLTPEAAERAPAWVAAIFASSLVMDVALLGFASWKYKSGKILTFVFALIALVLVGILLYNPNLLYESIEITNSGNVINFINNWYFWSYGSFIFAITMVFSGFLLYQVMHSKNKRSRRGLALFLGGLSASGTLSLIFDLMLPITMHRCDLLWVGAMSIGITILIFYYTILHYNILSMNMRWVKMLSYIILFTSGAALYMLVFFAVFTALFGTATPSFTIIMFNLIMVVIALLLTPAISELTASIMSLISTKQFNVSYIIRKLDKVNSKNTTARELSAFLASHLHFTYIGIMVKDKIYGSGAFVVDTESLTKITKMKNAKRSIWQTRELGSEISLVAELKNEKGEVFGKMIFGRPQGKMSLTQKELSQIEMIVNITATIIETEKLIRI